MNTLKSMALSAVFMVTMMASVAQAEEPMIENGGYYLVVSVATDFETTVENVTAELAERGFGVLSTIDVAAKMEEKLGVELPPQVILGACNPPFAHRALELEEWVATMMPCNVVVKQDSDGSVKVAAMNPAMIGEATGSEGVGAIGMETLPLIEDMLRAVEAAQ